MMWIWSISETRVDRLHEFCPGGVTHRCHANENPHRRPTPNPPMKPTSILLLTATILASTVLLYAQDQSPPPAVTATPLAYEALPTLDAREILQPQYLQGPNFTVRTSVPTYSGSNHYTIDSDFGVFEAEGNEMLMRRVAEI